MDFKEFAIKRNRSASSDFLRNIRAVPADKLTWKPEPDNRSLLEICQEVAQSPMWGVQILNARGWAGGTPEQMGEQMAQMQAERAAWDTVDKCEAAMNANLEKLEATIRAFPDEELSNVITLPFGGGMDMMLAEIAMVQNWNATYHLGQACFVQLMLGDKEMH